MAETTDAVEFYTIEPHKPSTGNFLETAAIRSCCICGAMVDGMGGGARKDLCVPCADDLMTGRIAEFLDVRGLCLSRRAKSS